MPQQDSTLDIRVTQTVQTMVNAGEDRSLWFFRRRVPLRRIEREWTPPKDPEDYRRQQLQEGFITADLLQEEISDELFADLRELDQHLLPHFWRVNQIAKFYQNRYYQYQWAFILAAFFTTAFAAVNVYVYAQNWQNGTHTLLGTIKWTELLGLLTAIISGIAAAVSFLDANETPQRRWYKARAQAETLRSLYFLFLAHQTPFNQATGRDRVQRMREKVIDVVRETRKSAQASPAAKPPNAPPADDTAGTVDDAANTSPRTP